MPTTVCHGLQTQFDPWLVEPRIVGFKLSSPTPKFSLSSRCFPKSVICDNSELQQNLHAQQQISTHKTEVCNEINPKKTSRTGDLGGWSFLQALSSTSIQSAEIENGKVHVHPLVKKSTSKLSEKSLEMCTESLGSETGSAISDSGDELMSSSSVLSEIEKSPRMPCFTARERSISANSFPPPLTTIGSSGGFQVKSQRQDGRLVIQAVSVGTHQSCFEAERSDGRLRLRFLDNSSSSSIKADEDMFQRDQVFDVNEYEYDDECDEEIVNDYQFINDMEESSVNTRDEVEVGDLNRLSRCKEEGADRRCKGMLSWESFWVASS